MDVICNDNRFEVIAKAKEHLLEATNIDTSPDEMEVIDNFLFRCWQMGWLDRYDEQTEPQTEITYQNCADALLKMWMDNILTDAEYNRTIDKLNKAHSKTEPNSSEKPNNCEPKICDTCRYYSSNIPCGSTPSACKKADKFAEEFVDGLKKLKPQAESVEPTWTKEEHEAFYTFLWNAINPNEMQDYIGMFEAKTEPQTERSE